LPAGVSVSSRGKRLLAFLLDSTLLIVTLGLGWIIWSLVICKDGTTPGKQLLGMRIVKTDTGQAASWFYTLLREWLVKDVISWATLGVGYIWILWDARRQNLYDKLLSTIVVDDPLGLTLATGQRGAASLPLPA
jgi:uncharacterized RDD family membrane protein YckC